MNRNLWTAVGSIIIVIVAIAGSTIYYYYYQRSQIFHRPDFTIPHAGIDSDKFGIKEIYSTKPGGEQWYFSTNDPNNDPRASKAEGPVTTFVQRNDDGSWKVTSTEVRYGVLTTSGWHPELITTLNQHELSAKGYMQSPNDWKNVEMTGYFKVNSFTYSTQNGPAHIELVARGGRSTMDSTMIDGLSEQCEASSYHSNTYVTGRVKFEKELEHTQGYTTRDPAKLHTMDSLQGRWIGIKAVFYNLPDHSVMLEQWIDESSNNNDWHKVLSYKDDGHWGGGYPNCGSLDNQVITWGGPIAIFRWDNIDDMDVKDFSIREIQSPVS